MRTVSLMGSTGSVGTQALDVIRTEPERFRVHALAAQRSVVRVVEDEIPLAVEDGPAPMRLHGSDAVGVLAHHHIGPLLHEEAALFPQPWSRIGETLVPAMHENHEPVEAAPVLGQRADHPDGIHRIRAGA